MSAQTPEAALQNVVTVIRTMPPSRSEGRFPESGIVTGFGNEYVRTQEGHVFPSVA